MKEEFLHFIWKNRLCDPDSLVTTDGIPVKVINPGDYNRDSGPDFFNSRLLIGETMWAGNIEIHIRSSYWELHRHHRDHCYDNVILHVVYEHDRDVYTSSGTRLDTVVIRWSNKIYDNYQKYVNAPGTIACLDDLHLLDFFHIRHWITANAVSRLESKAERIKPELRELHNDWEEMLYRLIMKYFGMNVNSEPFYMVACRLPLKILRKHSDNLLQVESLLYGQAGMLDEGLFREALDDNYYRLLIREYKVLSRKYSLKPVDGWLWKFHRMRPSNFPTVRLSQVALLVTTARHLIDSIRESDSANHLIDILNVPASGYWDDHYKFGVPTPSSSVKKAGAGLATSIIINCIVPLIFLYGREKSNQDYCNRAIQISESLAPESNRITREWESAGIIPVSAFESQGLIGLTESICKLRSCLDCQIGSKLICLGKDSDPRGKMVMEGSDNS